MRTIVKYIAPCILVAFATVSLSAQEKQKGNDLKKSKEKEQQKKELDSVAERSQAEYEFELQRLVEEQRKAAEEQEKMAEDQRIEADNQLNLIDLDALKNIEIPDIPDIEILGGGPNFTVIPPFPVGDGSKMFSISNNGNNTSFNISKRLKSETTFSGDFDFSIPADSKTIYINFSGSLDNGSLKVTITKPDKKVYQEFKVSPIANVRWNKKIGEEDIKEYIGTWKITISAQDAKGQYNMNISSF